jgi:hypothetical protein
MLHALLGLTDGIQHRKRIPRAYCTAKLGLAMSDTTECTMGKLRAFDIHFAIISAIKYNTSPSIAYSDVAA